MLAETECRLREFGALDGEEMPEFEPLRDAESRVVQAPGPTLTASTALPLNRVTSVVLQPGEDVVWTWTSTPDGGSYVSGYTIVEPG